MGESDEDEDVKLFDVVEDDFEEEEEVWDRGGGGCMVPGDCWERH